MIGLRIGTWQFIAEAPGFAPLEAPALVRVGGSPPMNFTLGRDPGPIPGALDRSVLQQVNAANGLRDRGQYEQALAAYQQIQEQNPKLTSVGLVIGDVYRKQAAAESDLAARRALLERALSSYTSLLGDESVGPRARAEIESTRAEMQALAK
jgi:tetratricopeptide (TPR) repeat protein